MVSVSASATMLAGHHYCHAVGLFVSLTDLEVICYKPCCVLWCRCLNWRILCLSYQVLAATSSQPPATVQVGCRTLCSYHLHSAHFSESVSNSVPSTQLNVKNRRNAGAVRLNIRICGVVYISCYGDNWHRFSTGRLSYRVTQPTNLLISLLARWWGLDILNAVRCPYVRSYVRNGGHGQISSKWRHNENDVAMTIAGLWRYGDWRHVATGCTALVVW